MPLLLSHHARLGVAAGGTQYACDTRHSKGDGKGPPLLGIPRGKAAMSWSLSSSHASPLCSQRLAAVPSHHDPAAADTSSSSAAISAANAAGANAAAAPASQEVAPDGDWEAVRLMTAARILASSSSDDATSVSGDAAASLDSDTSLLDVPDLSLSASPAAAPLLDTPLMVPSLGAGAGAGADATDPFSLAALARLDEIRTLDADSLALAVGILRQRQPLQGRGGEGEGGDEDGVQLSERLRDFLMVLRRRPAPTPAAPADPAAAAAGGVEDVFAMGAGEDDEWADVRSALMSIGINASLDEEDDEDVWALEAGRVKTRRTRLLRSLPKLDSSTAQQLTAFLAEVQQHSSNPEAPAAASQPGTTSSTTHDAAAASAGVSEEEEQWWQQASLAYSLLRQQAEKVQEQGAQQQLEEQQQ